MNTILKWLCDCLVYEAKESLGNTSKRGFYQEDVTQLKEMIKENKRNEK